MTRKNDTVGTERLTPETYSKWSRLVHTTARVVRFIKMKIPTLLSAFPTTVGGSLTVQEVDAAEMLWVKAAQQQAFARQLQTLKTTGKINPTDSLAKLCRTLDSNGVLRVGGRLQYSSLPFDTTHPIILPRKHWLTVLVIRKFHEEDGKHVRGVNDTFADLSIVLDNQRPRGSERL